MCGRFALRLPRAQIRQAVHEEDDLELDDEWIDEDEFVPRYNIAPRTYAPVIRRAVPGTSTSAQSSHHYSLQSMKWGLVPHWSKVEDKTLSTTNARSENLVEGGGMWAAIKGKKRCVVICQGYYEWLTRGKDKLPHFTKRKDGRLMFMAGLYDSVVLEGQQKPLWTFSIVTTAANKDFDWLHDRQPVIFSTKEAIEKWLDTSSQCWSSELSKLVEPYHDSSHPLECYQVPKEVGKVGTESPTFIQPISQRKDGIQAMFMKQKEKDRTTSASPQPLSRMKRLRSTTPPLSIDLTMDEDGKSSAGKHTEKNGGGEAVFLSPPSPSKKLKLKPSKSPSKKKGALEKNPSGSKITSFFTKSS